MAPSADRVETQRVAGPGSVAIGEMAAFLAAQRIEAHFDSVTRILYSTDASNHQILPLGVALPRTKDEVAAVVEKAVELKLPVLPRGAGTSLGGQAIGECLILDTAHHMNRIVSIDPEQRTAVVEPGVVCQALNEAARPHRLQYGPDPASADRATFGGMLGNNATGAHSIRFGMTSDHVLRVSLVGGDGGMLHLEALDEATARARSTGTTIEAEVLRTALDLRRSLADTMRDHWPQTWRRSSGYGLNYLVGYTPAAPASWYLAPDPYLPGDRIHLPGMFCGSEGTLGVMVEAEVRLVPRPAATALLLIPFESVVEACRATVGLLESEPAAVELIPAAILERARAIPAYARRLGFLESVPRALLAVEFDGRTPAEAAARAGAVSHKGIVLDDGRRQAEFWEVRKAGLGLLMSVPGDTKPITFIEDVAVPVERLPEYVEVVEAILTKHGTFGEWYAHASAGCLHLRPMVNLKSENGPRQMRTIAEAIVEEVFRLRGTVSGEHGDGLSHSEFNERLFGLELTAAFRRLKQAFDPKGILNPGKIVVLPGDPVPRIDGNLRTEGRAAPIRLETQFAFRREGGLLRAVEDCSGLGVCRKQGGVMCPSFQATRNERDSTRGRANALRAALSGWLPAESLVKPEMHAVLDLCLECKGCKAECPTGVDMARIKAEFLYRYQSRNGVQFRSRLLGRPDRLLGALRHAAPIHNRMRRGKAFRRLTQALFGIDRRRTLPELRSTTLKHEVAPLEASPHVDGDAAILFVDTFTDLSEPEVGRAALKLMRAAGVRAGRAPGQVCCGRPMISKGLLDDARRAARRNIDALAPYAEAEIPIVGLEPSCLLTLRDEYLEFFPDDPRAHAIARSARLLEEFLLEPGPEGGRARIDRITWKPQAGDAVVHNHCHAKALVGSAPLLEVLERIGGARETSAGCCGMAGSFGYEVEHYSLSMDIAEMRLLPELRQAAVRGAAAVAPGMSCRTQIRDGLGLEAIHPAVYLAERLEAR